MTVTIALIGFTFYSLSSSFAIFIIDFFTLFCLCLFFFFFFFISRMLSHIILSYCILFYLILSYFTQSTGGSPQARTYLSGQSQSLSPSICRYQYVSIATCGHVARLFYRSSLFSSSSCSSLRYLIFQFS